MQQHQSSLSTLQEKSNARIERAQTNSSLFKKKSRNRKISQEEDLQHDVETLGTLFNQGINTLIETMEEFLE